MMDALAARLHALNASFIPNTSSEETDELITFNSRVYLQYDIANPPPHPGKEFTRFICVSDTHGLTPQVPLGDVFIHAGDLSVYGRRKSFETTTKWLQSLPHPVKLCVQCWIQTL